MYYAYERIWARINRGKHEKCKVADPMKGKQKILWFFGTAICIFIVMWLFLLVTPNVLIKDISKEVQTQNK